MIAVAKYFFHHVAQFGDSGFLTVLSLLCAMYFYLVRSYRATVVLLLALVLCASAISVLKVFFIGCQHLYAGWHITSPSGHAAMSMAIYGTLAAIVAQHFDDWRRQIVLWGALGLVGVIAVQRLWSHAHTLNEVLLGLAVGGLFTFLSFLSLRNTERVPFHLRYLVLIALIPVFFFYNAHTPAEILIREITAFLKNIMPFCV